MTSTATLPRSPSSPSTGPTPTSTSSVARRTSSSGAPTASSSSRPATWTGSRPRRASELHLRQADHIPVGVGEHRDLRAVGNLHRRHDDLRAELLRLVELGLQVVDVHVERGVRPAAVVRLRNAAANALARAG